MKLDERVNVTRYICQRIYTEAMQLEGEKTELGKVEILDTLTRLGKQLVATTEN